MGGGNSDYNIIRTPSKAEFDNLVINSDLNASITPGSNLVWNQALSDFCTWLQNNDVGNAYLVGEFEGRYNQNNKAITYYYYEYRHTTFRPIIEYRE